MIHIIENLTTPANNKRLHELLLEHPWFYLKNTAYGHFLDNKQPYEPSWQHLLWNHGQSLSPVTDLAESLLIKALYESNMSCSTLDRIRAGMMMRTPYTVIHDPHVDWDNEHMTALYYVNDADGDTIFYDQIKPADSKENGLEWAKLQDFTVYKKIKPKADTIVIFNGLRYHSSSTPTETDHRIVLNFNWQQ
jgi:hypothetical protein